jgi:hypothetical protein
MFKDAFSAGHAIVNKPAKDLTSHKYSVQVSVPVKQVGKTVGVSVGRFGLEQVFVTICRTHGLGSQLRTKMNATENKKQPFSWIQAKALPRGTASL